MSILGDIRKELGSAISVAMPVSTYLAKNPSLPQALILPGEDYVAFSEKRSFCPLYDVTLNITVVSANTDNKAQTQDIDDYICNVIANLPDDYDLQGVSQPGEADISGKTYLVATVTVVKKNVEIK